MEPAISNISVEEDLFKFTLSGLNVSLANALRRTILNDIPITVIHTETYKDNQCNIEINNTTIVAGTYTLFTIPESEEITFIINKATNIWGAYRYNSENDILRFKVPINKAEESLEAFSIAFSENDEIAKIHFGWELVRFEVPFKVL